MDHIDPIPGYMSEMFRGESVGDDESFLAVCEAYAESKWPEAGKCSGSPFRDGRHRVGSVPIYSVLDGGMAGDVSRVVCLHCGEVMKDGERSPLGYFHPRNQPRDIGT